MKSGEIKDYAFGLLKPRADRTTLTFGKRLQEIRFNQKLKDWERDRLTEDAVEAEARLRVSLVSAAIAEVVETSMVVVSESELEKIFYELAPNVDVLRTKIYRACGGVGLSTGVGVGVGIDTGFRSAVEEETARLRLLAASSGRPGPYAGKDIVFISCGQATSEEQNLGQALSEMIDDETPVEGYFARNQQSLGGVSEHILGALGSAIGLVAILHRRGHVEGCPDMTYRGSVWIEQELAIASFRQQILQEKLDVVAYYETGVQLEGLRQTIILNAVQFSTAQEILADFHTRLANGLFTR